MVSSTARKDIEKLRAEGFDLGIDDIVHLNALALKAKLAAKPFKAMHLPRCVFLDRCGVLGSTLVLREPTIAHFLWLEGTAEYSGGGDLLAYAIMAFALSRRAAALPDPHRPSKVLRKVRRFARRIFRNATVEQLFDAVDYCLYGADWMAGEIVPKTADGSDGKSSEAESPAIGVIVDAFARRIPLTLDDAKRLTAAELAEVTLRARAADGDYDADEAHKEALADYYRAIKAIRERKAEAD